MFIHVPKTAGTSIREQLKHCYRGAIAYDYGCDSVLTHPILKNDENSVAEKISALEGLGVKLVFGHCLYETWSTVLERGQVMASIRNPVDRCISHYQHYLTRGGNDNVAELVRSGNMSLAEFSRHEKICNLQARMLSISEDKISDLRKFSSIFVTDLKLDGFHIRKRLNVGSRTFQVTADDVRQIILANHLDSLLYEMARQARKENYWRWGEIPTSRRVKLRVWGG